MELGDSSLESLGDQISGTLTRGEAKLRRQPDGIYPNSRKGHPDPHGREAVRVVRGRKSRNGMAPI